MTQVKFETVVHVELQRLGVIALSTETFSVFSRCSAEWRFWAEAEMDM